MQDRITCGADIHNVGDVLNTTRGRIRITGKRFFTDHVDYIVEKADGRVISDFAPPSRWSNVKEWVHGFLSNR